MAQPPVNRPPVGFGFQVNEYLNHFVAVADAKAAGVLTVDLALAGYLVAKQPVGMWPGIFHWMALCLLMGSGAMAIYTLYPRTPKIGSSVIFWEDISTRRSADAYLHDLVSANEAEIERQYAFQNYLVSGVLSKKYGWVRWGMSSLILAIPFILLAKLIGGQ